MEPPAGALDGHWGKGRPGNPSVLCLPVPTTHLRLDHVERGPPRTRTPCSAWDIFLLSLCSGSPGDGVPGAQPTGTSNIPGPWIWSCSLPGTTRKTGRGSCLVPTLPLGTSLPRPGKGRQSRVAAGCRHLRASWASGCSGPTRPPLSHPALSQETGSQKHQSNSPSLWSWGHSWGTNPRRMLTHWA